MVVNKKSSPAGTDAGGIPAALVVDTATALIEAALEGCRDVCFTMEILGLARRVVAVVPTSWGAPVADRVALQGDEFATALRVFQRLVDTEERREHERERERAVRFDMHRRHAAGGPPGLQAYELSSHDDDFGELDSYYYDDDDDDTRPSERQALFRRVAAELQAALGRPTR